MEDGALAGMVTQGDEAAFEVLYERHRWGVLALCRQLLRSPEEAEDALQHTFAVAYRELSGSNRPAHPRPWIYAIARNRCLSLLRQRREQPAERHPDLGAGLSEQVEQRAELRELVGDIGRLPEDQRAALVMSELGGVEHAEVAQVLGCERQKVRALVFQARATLRCWREARECPCAEIREHIAIGRGAELRRAPLHQHLQVCADCAAFQKTVVHKRRVGALVVAPVPATEPSEGVLESVPGRVRRPGWRLLH